MTETAVTAPTAPSRKRLIVPLAGLLVAAAVAVGSGADFVSNSVNTSNAFSTGTLVQAFSVTLAQAATNAEQGKNATATYSWNATQTAATTIDQ